VERVGHAKHPIAIENTSEMVMNLCNTAMFKAKDHLIWS
jgi:hypothetical protein